MSFIPPALKYIEGFSVTGLSVRTQNHDEFTEKTAKLPSLWQQFYSSQLPNKANTFEVYSDFESDANGLYTVTVGVLCDSAPPEFHSVTIQTGNYLVFQGKGPMPLTVIETWKQIWAYFETEGEYQRCFISDFEVYEGSDKVTVHVGINRTLTKIDWV